MTPPKHATTPRVLSADSLTGTPVRNPQGDDLGTIKAIMLDLEHGRVAYAVLAFGGFLGLGDELYALPWSSLKLDTRHESFVLDVPKETLQAAEGFDQENWPDFADARFRERTYEHYGQPPYWN